MRKNKNSSLATSQERREKWLYERVECYYLRKIHWFWGYRNKATEVSLVPGLTEYFLKNSGTASHGLVYRLGNHVVYRLVWGSRRPSKRSGRQRWQKRRVWGRCVRKSDGGGGLGERSRNAENCRFFEFSVGTNKQHSSYQGAIRRCLGGLLFYIYLLLCLTTPFIQAQESAIASSYRG